MKTKKFICDGSRSDNEVIQDAMDWAANGPKGEPRYAFVSNPKNKKVK